MRQRSCGRYPLKRGPSRSCKLKPSEAFFIAGNTLYFRTADKASQRRGAGNADPTSLWSG
jgi:hypothetical protein